MHRVTRLGFACLVVCSATLLGGCSSSNDARVTIGAWLPAPLALGMLSVRVDDGRSVWKLTAADFHLVGGTQYSGPTLQTANDGTLTVSYTLVPAAAAAVSAGAIELPLRKDWGYSVDIRPDTADPRRLCFGCAGSKGFPLAPEFRTLLADSVYVVWGGNSISHPVTY
jgi:hypothetical protein